MTHPIKRRFAAALLVLILTSAGLLTCGPEATPSATGTLPVQPLPRSLTCLVMGDWGVQGLLHQSQVAAQMDRYAGGVGAKFVLVTGDNFYLTGVSSTQDPQWQQSFERVYAGSHLQVPFKVVLGNHDYQQNAQAEVDYTKLSSRWQMPARYFTESVPIDGQMSVRLVFIDTNPFVGEYRQNPAGYPQIQQDTNRQLAWLDSVLARAPERWKIVVGHHPIRSVGTDHGDQPELVNQVQPLLTKYGVQAYFCGHSHTLQHLTTGGPTDYLISGAGGAPLGNVTPGSPARFATAVGGFAVLSVNADSLRVSFVNATGDRLYQMQRGY